MLATAIPSGRSGRAVANSTARIGVVGTALRRHVLGILATWLVLAALGLAACGSSEAPATPDPVPPGLDPADGLLQLSTADTAKLCDWVAQELGGYGGRSKACGEITLTSYANQATCISVFQAEPIICTVGGLESCVNAVIVGPCQAGFVPAGCESILSCN
jgi:hypothetical protein